MSLVGNAVERGNRELLMAGKAPRRSQQDERGKSLVEKRMTKRQKWAEHTSADQARERTEGRYDTQRSVRLTLGISRLIRDAGPDRSTPR